MSRPLYLNPILRQVIQIYITSQYVSKDLSENKQMKAKDKMQASFRQSVYHAVYVFKIQNTEPATDVLLQLLINWYHLLL